MLLNPDGINKPRALLVTLKLEGNLSWRTLEALRAGCPGCQAFIEYSIFRFSSPQTHHARAYCVSITGTLPQGLKLEILRYTEMSNANKAWSVKLRTVR